MFAESLLNNLFNTIIYIKAFTTIWLILFAVIITKHHGEMAAIINTNYGKTHNSHL